MNQIDIDEEQEGDGIMDWFKKRDPTMNPPKVRSMLEKYGGLRVNRLRVMRKPIQSMVRKALNIISFGKLQQIMNKMNYDELFHLGLIVGTDRGEFLIDKREVIKFEPFGGAEGAEYMEIPVNKDITIDEMLTRTQKFMGSRYGDYNAKNNNCQVFIFSILQANKLGNADIYRWILQDTGKIFSEMPVVIELLSKAATDAAAVANRIVEGGAQRELQQEDVAEKFTRILKTEAGRGIKKELMDIETIRKNPKLTGREKLLLQLSLQQ